MTIHTTAALAASRSGLSVFPPKEDGSKKPDTHRWAEYIHADDDGHLARLTEADIQALYAGGRTGMGIFTGTPSGGVELFDFDDRATYERFLDVAQAAGLGDLVKRIRSGYEEVTPNDGVHWLYRCPTSSGNSKLACRPTPTTGDRHKVKTLIETRGNGGYAVTWPSSGTVHESGRSYELRQGGFEWIVDITPEERQALWELARSFDEMPVRVARGQAPQRTEKTSERPGDIYNRRASWDETLPGWHPVFTRGQTTYWRRPGKDRGISATTNHTGKDTLIVFSSSTPFETVPTSYSKFAAYTLLEHGGDYAVAAKTLYATGYRHEEPAVSLSRARAGDCDEWRRLAGEQRQYIQLVARVRKNRALKHLRLTIIALAGEAEAAAEQGHIDAEGWFPIAVGDVLAEAAGVSRKTVGVHLERLAEWGVIEKDAWLIEAVDTETGWILPTKKKRTMIRLPGSGLDFLETMSTFEPPERAPGPHRCCSHAKNFLNPLRRFSTSDAEMDQDAHGSDSVHGNDLTSSGLAAEHLDQISTRKGGRNYAMDSKRPAGWGNPRSGMESCVACGWPTVGHVFCSGCDPGGFSATAARAVFGGKEN